MQSAKDTFYVMLRDRMAEINPARTAVLRGVTRPAVLVAENELATALFMTNAFWLRWVGFSIVSPDALAALSCEISYATDGTVENGGLDRGRLLAAMDLELATALRREPHHVAKTSYTSNGAGLMETNVFWGDPGFGKSTWDGERLSRTATVEVFCYPEAGEL